MAEDSLEINLGDVRDMRAKLPQAREILNRKEAKALAAQQEAHRWRKIVSVLVEAVGDAEPNPVDDQTPTAVPGEHGERNAVGERDHMRLSVDVLNRESRPMRAREVAELLRANGIAIENSEVSNALYYAANRARPPRVRKMPKRGVYAPLGLDVHAVTDYARAGELGFAAPDHLPANDDAGREA